MDMKELLTKRMNEIASSDKHRVNGMIQPTLVSCDPVKLISVISYKNFEWERNYRGEVHGGIVATMFDAAMGLSAASMYENKGVMTAEMQISYIRPFLGDFFYFTTEVLKYGNTLCRLRCVATNAETGEILGSAQGAYAAFRPKKADDMAWK